MGVCVFGCIRIVPQNGQIDNQRQDVDFGIQLLLNGLNPKKIIPWKTLREDYK
jgi:hypothetical protein